MKLKIGSLDERIKEPDGICKFIVAVRESPKTTEAWENAEIEYHSKYESRERETTHKEIAIDAGLDSSASYVLGGGRVYITDDKVLSFFGVSGTYGIPDQVFLKEISDELLAAYRGIVPEIERIEFGLG